MYARLACLGLIMLYSLPGLASESVHDHQPRDLSGQLEQAINGE